MVGFSLIYNNIRNMDYCTVFMKTLLPKNIKDCFPHTFIPFFKFNHITKYTFVVFSVVFLDLCK